MRRPGPLTARTPTRLPAVPVATALPARLRQTRSTTQGPNLQTTLKLARRQLRRIAIEAAQLPGVDRLARPVYRQMFKRPSYGNRYYGIYDSYEDARAAAPATLPTTYDTDAAARMYRRQLEAIHLYDYPAIHWLSRLFAGGCRTVFDLGGHIGLAYYAYRRHLDYPDRLRWTVHDVASVTAAGRAWAEEHDASRRLAFTDVPDDAGGADILFTSGALQYLDYSLPELLARLDAPPPHVLVNVVPMHAGRSYFTLQNFNVAICPYRVASLPGFVGEMEALGYTAVDRWEVEHRTVQVPFAPEFDVDAYYGFYFSRSGAPAPRPCSGPAVAAGG